MYRPFKPQRGLTFGINTRDISLGCLCDGLSGFKKCFSSPYLNPVTDTCHPYIADLNGGLNHLYPATCESYPERATHTWPRATPWDDLK